MRPGVSNHGVLNPILPIEPAEDQSQSSVEQEATEQHKRRQSTEHDNRSRQVPSNFEFSYSYLYPFLSLRSGTKRYENGFPERIFSL